MNSAVKPAPVIWIAGLSQSGKTTLANGIADWLRANGHTAQVLDGRFVRDEVGDFFGYSREERIKVSRLLTVIAKVLAENGVTVVVTSITPYQESRDFSRATLARYFEVYLECSVDECIARDKSGLWARAERGDLRHFIGIDDPFELPRSADLKIDTCTLPPAEVLADALRGLESFLHQ